MCDEVLCMALGYTHGIGTGYGVVIVYTLSARGVWSSYGLIGRGEGMYQVYQVLWETWKNLICSTLIFVLSLTLSFIFCSTPTLATPSFRCNSPEVCPLRLRVTSFSLVCLSFL